MRSGVGFLGALHVLWLGALGRCPGCRTQSMFRGFATLYERCPNCGIKYEREDGAWLGALALGYTAGALAAVLLGLVELRWHPIRELGLHPLGTIIVVSLLVTVPAYRPAKGVWFALLWLFEFTDDAERATEAGAEPR